MLRPPPLRLLLLRLLLRLLQSPPRRHARSFQPPTNRLPLQRQPPHPHRHRRRNNLHQLVLVLLLASPPPSPHLTCRPHSQTLFLPAVYLPCTARLPIRLCRHHKNSLPRHARNLQPSSQHPHRQPS